MKTAIVLAAALSLTTGAAAQTAASQAAAPQTEQTTQGGFGGLGGLGGLLGGGLPNVGSVGAGNAAGLLGYCLKNKLLGQGGMLGGLTGSQTGTQATPQASGAQSILQRLTGRRDVQTSPGYAAGQAGQVQAGNGQTLSLGNLGGQVKTQLCNVVLKRAKAFL
ncbi:MULTISPECIES: DUF2501 domain-containing protein [unclassified Sphingomonas]|uniref:DUF2501 domain-containing protein n=1 Tax=unclassified Sphingomonas TaxID=196159 RepID=UPI0007014E11|nr:MULTISPECIES: DUF2501 domain-containing protein [unclassified Sphingomonas]KQN29215.1 hypothetical protein ASE88_09680 [Sphingomonas sp. Leaf38]KQN31592.1 hypothetical protein ASF00_01985 [Sphingomonas sp. Leaf34]